MGYAINLSLISSKVKLGRGNVICRMKCSVSSKQMLFIM